MILAAGAVLWRPGNAGGLDVCVVHRPKYDDWSLPKGKVDPGEHLLSAAMREVREETGHTVVLGRPLPTQEYDVAGEPKRVYYWAARADDGAGEWPGTKEIDRLAFLPTSAAIAGLTREVDAELVRVLADDPEPTQTFVILRHAKALPRDGWDPPDGPRPLTADGEADAKALVPLLAAYGVRTVASSDAVRCLRTVEPYVDATGADLITDPGLAEGGELRAETIRELQEASSAVVCSHRPVLPLIYEAVGIDPPEEPLHPGDFLVLHHRGRTVVASERHRPRADVTLFT